MRIPISRVRCSTAYAMIRKFLPRRQRSHDAKVCAKSVSLAETGQASIWSEAKAKADATVCPAVPA